MKKIKAAFSAAWRFITAPARWLAKVIVTYYSTRMYDKAVAEADKWHEESGKIIYVTSALVSENKLVVMDGDGFRRIKQKANMKGDQYPMRSFRQYGCWYHTPDKEGYYGMSDKEKELKRLAFIKLMLIEAKLVEAVDPAKYSKRIRATK